MKLQYEHIFGEVLRLSKYHQDQVLLEISSCAPFKTYSCFFFFCPYDLFLHLSHFIYSLQSCFPPLFFFSFFYHHQLNFQTITSLCACHSDTLNTHVI